MIRTMGNQQPIYEYKIIVVIEDKDEWLFPDYAARGIAVARDMAAQTLSIGNSLKETHPFILHVVADHMQKYSELEGW